VSCGAGVEDLGRRPLEGHLIQGGNEASLIPDAMLWRGWSGDVGELGRGERSVSLGLSEGVEDSRAGPGRVRRWRAPGLLMHPGGLGGQQYHGAAGGAEDLCPPLNWESHLPFFQRPPLP
jgi:hypothetical protein